VPKRRQGDWGDGCLELSQPLEPVRARKRDGDREMERRSVRTAELTSIVWACVGEGRARVPPLLLEKDIVWNVNW
jgi:hypothetical protein